MTNSFKILYFISMFLFPVIVSSCIGPSMVTSQGFHFKKQRGLNLQGKSFVVNTIDATVSEDDKIRLAEVLEKKLRTISGSVHSVSALRSIGHDVAVIPYYADTASLNHIARISSGNYLVNSMAGETSSSGLGSSFVVGLTVYDLHTHEMIYEQATEVVDSELDTDARFSFTFYKSDKRVIQKGLAAVVRDLRRASKPK